jgi:GT2 family glycosyltransferase
MDICVVTYHSTVERIAPLVRTQDRLFVHDNTHDNRGFAAGANAAARRGCDPLVLFVNPDGDPAPDCFERLERALDDPTVVAAAASQGPGWAPPPLTSPAGDTEWLSGGCLVVRRAPFEAVGGFDERLFMYGEDVDLSYKLAAHGRLLHVAAAVFHHDPSPRSFRANHRAFRNWLVVQRRHRVARPVQMLRDASWAFRDGRSAEGLARLTGVADYLLRARRWA